MARPISEARQGVTLSIVKQQIKPFTKSPTHHFPFRVPDSLSGTLSNTVSIDLKKQDLEVFILQ